ncbi:MAG: hypothetical protein FJX76_13400 [Armatimonadetes bacterium]|nr:hypothetical protein [Armatimonadota bacterium]
MTTSPSATSKIYQEAPESALVRAADGAYVSLAEAPQRDIEWAKRMAQIDVRPEDRPQVKDMGDSVSIGGIVLKKRPSRA